MSILHPIYNLLALPIIMIDDRAVELLYIRSIRSCPRRFHSLLYYSIGLPFYYLKIHCTWFRQFYPNFVPDYYVLRAFAFG